MIFCSVVMVSSNAPRPGASPPRPLRARLGSRFAVGTGHLCQIKFWLMQIICANLHVMVYLLNQLNITRVFITNDFVVGDGQLTFWLIFTSSRFLWEFISVKENTLVISITAPLSNEFLWKCWRCSTSPPHAEQNDSEDCDCM